MAGKSNRGRNHNGSQQSAMNSSEQAISSDAPLNGTSSAIQANGDTILSESNDTNSEVKDQDNASHQHQTKQADIHLYPVSVKTQGGEKLELQLSPGDSVMDVRQFLLDAPETCFLTCYDLLLHAKDGSVHHLEDYNEISEVADISSGSCFLEMIPVMQIPVIDLAPYLEFSGKLRSPGKEELDSNLKDLCLEVSRTLRETGALLVKDPRCSAEDNDRFLDMMEKYFEMPDDFKRRQERSHLHYQVGVTPEGVEVPRSLVDEEMQETLRAMPIEFQPSTPIGPDPKWRYMWRVGPRPSSTRFKELNSEPVIPDGFPEWKDTMDSWGYKMISAIEAVAEMAAVGFGLQKDAFTSLMKQGPHLLAPTGSDLSRHGQIGTVFAGYHYDLNFLTIHGRSRFPGLNIWLRNGQKMEVKVPVGCLLIQTGKQIEWLTAGDCIAGMHEVVVTDRTIDAIKLASEQNHSLWRVSSTLFAHIASDAVLKPLGHFADSSLACQYSPMCAGEFVEQELSVINLKGSKGDA